MNLQRRNLAAHQLEHMLQLQRALRELARHLRGGAHLLALGVHAKRHRAIWRGGLRLYQPRRNGRSATVVVALVVYHRIVGQVR